MLKLVPNHPIHYIAPYSFAMFLSIKESHAVDTLGFLGCLSTQSFLCACCPILKSSQATLSPADDLLALMKIRLNHHLKDLAYCFSIAVSIAGDVFHGWI